MKQQFRVRPDGFAEIRKRILIRAIPVLLIAITLGLVISQVNNQDKETDINILPFFIPAVVLIAGLSLRSGLNKQKKLLESYLLTIDDNVITRQQLSTPEITIYFHEVKEILKNQRGGIAIKGFDATDIIYIPAQIERYAELETLLNQVKPVTAPGAATSALAKILSPIISLSGLVLLGIVYLVENKIAVGIAGTGCIILMSWSLIQIQRSKNVDTKTKKRRWILLIVIFAVLAIMFLKLAAPATP